MVLLIVGIIGIVIGGLLWQSSKGSKTDPTKDPTVRIWGISGIVLGVVLLVGSVIYGSFTTIPAGQRGVVIRFGAVTGD
ncbi:MAG: hypothetical protein HYX95_01030, partial [Chloroflexi bacterium]|nr:hypothetical protein [Chloroflexota bacterium]